MYKLLHFNGNNYYLVKMNGVVIESFYSCKSKTYLSDYVGKTMSYMHKRYEFTEEDIKSVI